MLPQVLRRVRLEVEFIAKAVLQESKLNDATLSADML